MPPRRESVATAAHWTILAALAAIALALGLTHLHDYGLYARIMERLGVDAPETSFLDWIYVPANMRCWQSGVDVYVVNPCDPVRRLMDYSPLWLRMRFLPTGPAGLRAGAILVGAVFCASLLLLPIAARPRARLVSALAILSPATLFLLERANVDALMVALLVAAAVLLARSFPLRVAAHALILVAGLLKYYPLAAGLLLLRERTAARRLAIGAAYAAVLGLFAVVLWPEIAASLRNVPRSAYFWSTFGAENLPSGIAQLAAHALRPDLAAETLPTADRFTPAGPYLVVSRALLFALVFASIAAAFALAGRIAAPDRPRLDDRAGSLFAVAAVTLAGCFFSAQGFAYRAVLILPLLPFLLDGAGRLRRAMLAAALVLLWTAAIQSALLDLLVPHVGLQAIVTGVWLVREAIWWAFVTMLDAHLLAALLPPAGARAAVR